MATQQGFSCVLSEEWLIRCSPLSRFLCIRHVLRNQDASHFSNCFPPSLFFPYFLFLNQMRPQVPRLSERLVGLPAVRVRGPPGALRQEQRGASVRHQRPGAPEPVPPAAGGEDPGLHGPLPGEVGGASVDCDCFRVSASLLRHTLLLLQEPEGFF